jgi:3D (Asp-Asp-Asp) domain-containing protein
VCVQGSGTLKAGGTVSFAKRDCACAAECPRTGQRICFDLLDKAQFPWGRGAMGKAITPLTTVAVDSNVIPLGTPLYIPEYDGVARDPSGNAVHDGCFLAEDRGLKVQGQHVDIFTGHSDITRLWNRLVPSNKGVTVVLESPRCKRAP